MWLKDEYGNLRNLLQARAIEEAPIFNEKGEKAVGAALRIVWPDGTSETLHPKTTKTMAQAKYAKEAIYAALKTGTKAGELGKDILWGSGS